jgi:hypothetical protein
MDHRGTRWWKVIAPLLGVISWAGGSPAATITIADSTQGYTNFSLPALSDGGVVAFNATKNGSAKVFTGSGGPVASFDPAALGSNILVGDPSINNAGHVGFVVDSPDLIGLHTGAYLWSGGASITTVLDPNAHGGIHDANPIVTMSRGSDLVYVAFSEEFAQGRIITQSGGVLLGAVYHLGRPVVSSNGVLIVTGATHNNGPIDNFFLEGAPNNVNWSGGLHVASDPNTVPTPGSPMTVTGFTGYGSSIAINAAGTIALSLVGYGANNVPPPATATFAFDNSGNGTFLSHGAVSNLAINDLGTILPFTGFSVDDLGSPIVSLDYIPDGLNNDNQIAFRATLANGTTGIYVTSIPEPTSLLAVVLPISAIIVARRGHRHSQQRAIA